MGAKVTCRLLSVPQKSLYCTTNFYFMKENSTEAKMFEKDNLLWMGIGVAVMALGMFLMAGGKSSDPKVFNKDEVYSTMRITVAPIVILAGLCIGVFAIFKKPKQN
jgi:hypothetical protein